MNTNARFLNEAKELGTRWAKSGLLEGMDKSMSRQSAAVLMECERLHNETGTWDCCDECKEREKREKKPKPKPWWLKQLKKRLFAGVPGTQG